MRLPRIFFLLLLTFLSIGGPIRADEQTFSKQQLDQMLAPIALYPDDLLSNVLMASTYPLDVVEAERWRSDPANAKLQGDALVDALESKDWDPSIKALVQFPDVLKMMSDQLDWTQKLGDAFLAQQDEVMDQVQFLRQKADSSGHLKSNPQQTVTQDDGAYVIRPADPDTVYVPVYEPSVVYGSWWYPDYPPYYWGYPGATFVNGYFWAETGVAIAGGIWGWNRWDWHNHRIDVDVNRWNHIDVNRRNINSNVWKHDPNHGGRPGRDKTIDRARIDDRLKNSDHKAPDNRFTPGNKPRSADRPLDKGKIGSGNVGKDRVGKAKVGKPKAAPARRTSGPKKVAKPAKKPAARAHRGGGGRGHKRRR